MPGDFKYPEDELLGTAQKLADTVYNVPTTTFESLSFSEYKSIFNTSAEDTMVAYNGLLSNEASIHTASTDYHLLSCSELLTGSTLYSLSEFELLTASAVLLTSEFIPTVF